uniref:Nucleoporin NUP42 n=1 Tax=Nothobranchius kadleci TaxID=1051664 RepID=A0A1A8CLI0_NOTKA
MENDGKESAEEAKQSFPRTQQLCRFFSQGRRCNFGNKCKFLHVRELKADKALNQSDATISDSQGQHEEHKLPVSHNPRIAQAAARRPCRYFLSGHCSMEDRCRFWHPQEILDSVPVAGNHNKAAQSFPPVSRPSGPQEVKLCNVTEDVAKQLRETEIRQLKKRFPKDQLIVQERSDGKVTYYRVTVEATDPDWPFDLKEIDVMVSFPDNYPLEIFTLDIPLDQDLPPLMAKHVQQASIEWLQAKHATNQLLGKLELLFRPFLRWLDRSLERLFTEGARQLKKDIDLEKAGLQFIPYQELKVTASENSDDAVGEGDACNKNETVEGVWSDREETSGQEECPDCDEGQQEEEASHLVENIKISDPRRGTEVKLLGLRLGEYTATVVAQQITVCLQCHRCKVTADLTLSGRTTCAAQCEKCNASISAAFRPCMLHHYSDVLGYLDLHNATAADLILQDCDLIVGCLSCSQDVPVQHVFYGQTKEFNCEQCHSKLSILVESTRFQFIPPRPSNKSGSSSVNYKTIRDPAVQKGKPLPEKGTCKHYKQSHRWLRFPCCGRAYPCDGCHDENQDHPMELATRMICGFCAKEQPYNNGKPCVSCGSMMTRGTRTSHWEGGLGCRNKAKMSRNDRQKYSNSNKTVSRKAAGDKK